MPKVSAIKVKTKQVSHNEYNKYNKYLSLVVDYDLRTPNKEKVETACSFTTATAYVNRKRTLARIVFQNDDETLIRVNLKKRKAEYKSMSTDLLQYHLYVRYEKYLR